MAALTSTRKSVPKRLRSFVEIPVADDAVIYGGALVAINASGYAVAASTATGLVVVGPSESSDIDNTDGGNGAVKVRVRLPFERWEFLYANDSGTAVDQGDLFRDVYALDDQTVTADSTGASVAGKAAEVTSDGVWVYHSTVA
jgi:hypothetical protein